jgi:CMP-N,N'-diacetyllegionaminic acid synthase
MASLGVVVARGQSKRLPRKMLRPLAGHPLIAYMARAALASGLDRVILSTDDDEIVAAGKSYGIEAPFRRPAELATDFATNDRVLMHALDWVEANERRSYATAVLLQPTAPFTIPEDIDGCVKALGHTNANCCFTAAPVSEQPHWMFVPQESGEVELLMPGHLSGDRQHTQKLPRYLHPSGAVWAVRASALRETGRVYCAPMRTVEVPPERAIDIDTALDLLVAEAAAQQFGLALAEPRRRVA